ncbi:23S rRNA methyluridine methyltransferase [Vibrio cholerae]|nr:23S rRNA methyluridine methyltransferase [Vibrio cholerae]
MLRFVARSHAVLERIERNLPTLIAAFPMIEVISVNIQPVHMARLEGEEEIFLTETQSLLEHFNDVPMVIRPKSFFQTNPKVAEQLYATARTWVREIAPTQMWDLFCGVGGFALHCAAPDTAVTGIEIEPEAIASAQRSAQMMGIDNLSFAALDSAKFSQSQMSAPELVLVNPPRRGLGSELTAQLEALAPKYILYSSCNPQTMVKDIAELSSYQMIRVQWFDMFPHTDHAEVLTLLVRK